MLFASVAEIQAASVKAELTKKTGEMPIKGTFSQRKNIKPLKRPFISTGAFVYLPQKGLLWQTKSPVNSTKLFANEGVFSLDEKGVLNKESQLDNDFFLALFSADEEKLAPYFTTVTITTDTKKHGLCLALTPKSAALLSLFQQINLCRNTVGLTDGITKGNNDTKLPSTITLIEAKGNTTEIRLQLSSEPVSSKELAYFDW